MHHAVLFAVLLACMPTGRAWSVDAWRRRRRGDVDATSVPVWCRHVLQLQIAVVYGATGLLKTRPVVQPLGVLYLVSYCKYGFPYRKHTHLWSNCPPP